MSALELDDNGARYIDELAATKGVPLGTPSDVSFFDGALGAPVKGLMRGIIAKPAKLVGDAATPVLKPMARAVDSAFGGTVVSDYLEGELKKNNQLLDDLRPDPATTGMAGQLLHGLFDIGSSALLYTPEGAAIMEGYSRRQELIDKGVDSKTATAAGAVSGAALFAGVKAPMTMGAVAVGRGATGAAANVAVGAGTNMAAGIAERGFTSDLLERAGYKDMATQYQPYDQQSMITEAVLGTVLSLGVGSFEGYSARRQAALDAALAARGALHAARDTAPGLPVNAESAAAHRSALDLAIEQALRGEPVNVPDSITEAEFVRPAGTGPETPIAAAIREAYRNDLPAAERYVSSERLAQIPLDQRRALRFDAPELNEFAASVEQKYGLPGGLINALKNAGEKSGSTSVSPAGARGVMQFMPENLRKFGVTDATDPVQIIDAAGRYLRETMRQYGGNIDAVIADYNGGPRQARRVLNGAAPAAAETRAYLIRVKEYLGRQEQSTRVAKQPSADEFATSVGRVAEVSPETGAPTFRNGTAYSGDQIQSFFDQALANQPAGAAIPDVLFRIGRIDDQVAAGLQQFLPAFDDATREARISSQVIDQIRQLQPEIARDLLAKLEEGALYADEVLPNPQNVDRALLTLRDGTDEGRPVTILDVAAGENGIDVMSATVGTARDLEPAAALKQQIEVSRPPETNNQAAESATGSDIAATKRGLDAPEQPQSASNARAGGDVPTAPDLQAQTGDFKSSRSVDDGDVPLQSQEMDIARSIADELADLVVTMDDGTELTAREALAQADEVIAQARTEARAFDAAVTCYLRKGS